jgi:hypothetical protein
LKQCTKEDLDEFVPKKAQKFYPNALCFEDKSKIDLFSNWFADEYKSLMLVIEECQDAPGKNVTCASSEEITNFSERNVFYLIRQETLVDSEIYYDTAEDFKDENSKSYFPLKKMMKSEFYDAVEVPSGEHQSHHEHGIVEILEIALGLNKITIDDSFLQIELGSEKHKHFIDVSGTRYIKDRRSYYSYEGSHPLMIFYFGIFN